jgi:hypothetical protein
MRAALLVLVLSTTSSAGPIARTRFLGGHVSLRLLEGMVANDDSAVLPAAHFTLVAMVDAPLDGEDPRGRIASDRELVGTRIERISTVRSGPAYAAAPALPRRDGGRVLVYAVQAVTPDGIVVVLRFYIDGDEIDEARFWAGRASAIAATLELHPEPSLPDRVIDPPPPVGPHGACDVRDHALDVTPQAPPDAKHVPGDFRGDLVFWGVWSDRFGHHAELIVGATGWGRLHARCTADSAAELARLRAEVEALWP